MNSSDQGFHSLVQTLRRTGLVREPETPRALPLTGGVSTLIVLAKAARGLLCVKQAPPHGIATTTAQE